MISFANLHDDIGNDLFDHKEQLNRLDEFHYPRFKEGNMKFSAIVCCFSGTESWQDMQECIVYANDCIHSSNISHLTTIKIFKSLSLLKVCVELKKMSQIKFNGYMIIMCVLAHYAGTMIMP